MWKMYTYENEKADELAVKGTNMICNIIEDIPKDSDKFCIKKGNLSLKITL
jgi:hypothetical protein